MGSKNSWNNFRSTNLLIGFALSIAFCLMAFAYTTDTISSNLHSRLYKIDNEEIEIIRTPTQKNKSKPIPPPDKIILKEIIEPHQDVTFKTDLIPEVITEANDAIIDSNFINDAGLKADKDLPPAPPPPKAPEEPSDLPPISFAEHMAYYGDCNTSHITKVEKKQCSDKAFLIYLRDHIKYPAMAKENGIEGLAVIEIIIGKKGELESAKIIRNPGGGLGEEALRVIKNMDNWSPARQGGKNVRLIMRLPVKFQLD